MSMIEPIPAPQENSSHKILLGAIKWILLVAVLGLVVRALYRQFKLIDIHTVHVRPLPLLAAILSLMLVPIIQLISYRVMLGAYAHSPPWRGLAAAAWVPMLGKYIPGKVASFAGAVYILRKFDIPGAIALSIVIALDGMMVVTGLITGAPLFLWEPVKRVLPNGWIWCGLVLAAGVICLHPQVYGRIVNFGLKKLKRQPLDHMPPLRIYTVPIICCFVQWVCVGFTLWFLIISVAGPTPASKILLLISIGGLAYTASYLALFAPAGIGVREAVFLATLSALVPPSTAAIVVVGTRIVQIIVELLTALAGLIVLRSATHEGFLASSTTR